MNSKPAPRRAVVVGVDGSPANDLALGWAVEEASVNGGPAASLMGQDLWPPSGFLVRGAWEHGQRRSS